MKKNLPNKINKNLFYRSLAGDIKVPQAVHDYYQKIISCMPNNVYWLDRNCITQGCNSNVLKLVGLESLDEFVGITYEQMGKLAGWTEGQAESFKKDDMEAMQTGIAKINVEEPPLYNAQGEPSYYFSSRVPIFDEKEEVIGVVGISVDITERKKLEELKLSKALTEQINKAKSIFLAVLNQRAKSALCSILGAAEIIKTLSTDSKIQDTTNIVLDASKEWLREMDLILNHLSADLSDATFIEYEFDFHETLKHVVFGRKGYAKQHNVDILVKYNEQLFNFFGNQLEIQKILEIVLSKSIDRSSNNEVLLEVFYTNQTETSVDLNIKLIDKGLLIPKEKVKGIFDFLTAPDSLENIANIDLELSIASDKLKRIGGNLLIINDVNHSEFLIHIPLKINSVSKKNSSFETSIKKVAILTNSASKAIILSGALAQFKCELINDSHNLTTLFEQNYDSLVIDMPIDINRLAAFAKLAKEKGMSIQIVKNNNFKLSEQDNLFLLQNPINGYNFMHEFIYNHARSIKIAGSKLTILLNLRVLVVEDNVINMQVIVGLLESLGCQVFQAVNAQQALLLATTQRFDFALLDISLPDINGPELAIKLLAIDNNLKISAITAVGTDSEKEKCLDAGMLDVLDKPIARVDLIYLFNEHLST